MKNKMLLLLLLVICTCSGLTAQQHKRKSKTKKRYGHGVVAAPPVPEIFVSVSQLAEFPGGAESLKQYLRNHIRYPAAAREDGIQGKVIARFVLDTNGAVSRKELLKDIGGGCGKEVLRVLQQMPQWKPYRYNGRKVPYVVVLTAGFRINK